MRYLITSIAMQYEENKTPSVPDRASLVRDDGNKKAPVETEA